MFTEDGMYQSNGMSASVSIGDWLKLMCLGLLNFIPVVGSLAHLVVLIYLAASRSTAKSMKSYLCASFIFVGICLVVSLVFLALVFNGSLRLLALLP